MPKSKKTKQTNPEPEIQIQDNYKDQYLRLAADFENFRKRTITEKADSQNYAKADIILALLPILNNLNLALKHTPEGIDSNWLTGINHIQKQLEDTLLTQNFKFINASEGEAFDHNLHEAISYENSALAENSIIELIEPGLIFNDKVLKPARVRVSKGN